MARLACARFSVVVHTLFVAYEAHVRFLGGAARRPRAMCSCI
jgi:hypothetical protein